MAYWLNKKLGTHWRPRTWAPLPGVLAFILIVAGIFSITLASHSTSSWPFDTPGNYTITPAGDIEVSGGLALLPKDFTDTDSAAADFDGAHNNTQAVVDPPDYVNLVSTSTDSLAVGGGVVGSGSYTSSAIRARVATTTWKNLTSTIVLQKAPAASTYSGTGTTLGSGFAGGIEVSAGDITGDGLNDIVITAWEDMALFYYENADPIPAPFTKRVAYGAWTPCTAGFIEIVDGGDPVQ